MADEIRQYTAVIPAGTLSTAPISVPMAMPPRNIEAIQIIVPPGPNGVVGFAIAVSGLRIIPYGSDLWIITSGENITWPLEGYPDSGAWSLIGYNTGTQDHSVFVRWLVKYINVAGPKAPAMIDNSQLEPPIAASDIALTGGP